MDQKSEDEADENSLKQVKRINVTYKLDCFCLFISIIIIM